MDAKRKLQIINGETDLQVRLALLADHGFIAEATQLISHFVRTYTAMFYHEWYDSEFCFSLPRATNSDSPLYVVITTSSKLDYDPRQTKKGEKHIIFELGWEQEVLGWTKEESQQLAYSILSQIVARPLSQWSLNQAEGTARACRRLLPADDPVAREIAALHLVYHLRAADFGRICHYLGDIPDFPFGDEKVPYKSFDEEGFVNWIVERLSALGWTAEQIRKELLEWMWLKTTVSPVSFLGVAKANIFAEDDAARATVIRRWLCQRISYLLNDLSALRSERHEHACRRLFHLGRFEAPERGLILTRLAEQLAEGDIRSVQWFLNQFGHVLLLDGFNFNVIREHAIKIAANAGNYGTAVALHEFPREEAPSAWLEIVQLKGLSTSLKR